MAEQVGRAPQQLDSGFLHGRRRPVDETREVGIAFGQRRSLRRQVTVVEAEEGRTQLAQEFESSRELALGQNKRIALPHPRPVERRGAEHVLTVGAEAVPVGNGEPQVILHPLAQHPTLRVVPTEGQRIGRLRSLVGDLAHGRKIRCHGPVPFPRVGGLDRWHQYEAFCLMLMPQNDVFSSRRCQHRFSISSPAALHFLAK